MIVAWYNYDKANSYNAHFNMILTNRGYGKTYGAKKRCVNRFLKYGEQFVYIRRYKTELKKIWKFFDDMKMEFPDVKFEVKGTLLYINEELAGYGMPLSTSLIEKSNPYPLVTTIVFDEFIIDKAHLRYLTNEVDVLLELIFTICRKRNNWKCYLLANNITTVNPYFRYFNIHIKDNERFTLAQNGEILVERSTDDVFVEEMKETAFGKLIQGTKYSDYAIENKALRDSNTFIEKLPLKDCIPFYYMTYKDFKIQVWGSKTSDLFYCNDKIVEGTPSISLIPDDHDENSILRGKQIRMTYLDDLVKTFQVGRVRFSSQDVKSTVYEIFKKLGVS